MFCKKISISFFLLIFASVISAQNKVSISSPNGQLVFSFALDQGHPEYSVKYKKKTLIEHSRLGLAFINNDAFGDDIEVKHISVSSGTDDYNLPEGKTSKVHDTYQEASIPLQAIKGDERLVFLRIRAFNDGIAFRYEFPLQNGWANYILTDENTEFNLVNNPTARVAFLEDFFTSHEHRYNKLPLHDIKNDTLMDMPALFEFPGKTYMAITEADLVDYAGMSLIKKNGMLMSQLTPLPGQSSIKVKATLPHHSPWRVMM
ncbi:MAG: glycoside hydrolase family 97 N-terminal domain-containing protein, partial [Ginsengibacter sp.]